MSSDIGEFEELHAETAKNLKAEVFNENFLNALEFCRKDSIDLLVTSLRYLNNYHYLLHNSTTALLAWHYNRS